MAKKQVMNPLETHLEKIVLVLAIGVGVSVFILSFLDRRGESAFERTKKAALQAEKIAQSSQENVPPEQLPPPYQHLASDFIEVAPLVAIAAESYPPSPPPVPEDIMPATPETIQVPKITALGNVIIDFTRTQAWLPSVEGEGEGINQQFEIRDIDFVTVEVVFQLASLRSRFEKSFKNPDLPEEVKYPEPIIAGVELERSQLRPDGSWGVWEKVERFETDPMAKKDIPNDFVSKNSPAEYEVLLSTRGDPETQLLILQPQPPKLLKGAWLPPSQNFLNQQDTMFHP